MIEDLELRDIYKVATAERLQKLEASLLRLEKQPKDDRSLDEFLREAHTLKGDSRMLGVTDVETLTHQIEDCLAAVKKGEARLNGEMFDRLYQGLDAIRSLIDEAVTGQESGVNVFQVLARLMGSAGEPEEPEEPEEPVKENVENTTGETLETIRVESEKLDRLLMKSGELAVTSGSVARQTKEIESILNFCQEWQKERVFNLENQRERLNHLGHLLDKLKNTAAENTARLEAVTIDIEGGVRQLRLLPLSTLFNLFPRMVRDLARTQGKEIDLIIEGGEILADKKIIEEMRDPLLHILRNAIDHGIETPQERKVTGKSGRATLTLRGYSSGGRVGIEVRDDGRGLDLEKIKQTALARGLVTPIEIGNYSTEQLQSLIFAPGFSTRTHISEISGRGIGLDVVKTTIERLKGTIRIISLPANGCTFNIELVPTLATTSVLTVKTGDAVCALPIEAVENVRSISPGELSTLQGRTVLNYLEYPVPLVSLAELLELPLREERFSTPGSLPCVLLKIGEERLALSVDAIDDRIDIIVKPFCKLIKRVRNVSGATILSDGQICTILNPSDLLASARKQRSGRLTDYSPPFGGTKINNKLLLVEDSLVIRTQMQRLLTLAGFEVTIAENGEEGLKKLGNDAFAAVVSDVEMPRLNGLEMTAKIRENTEYRDIPIVLVTTLASEEDRRKGFESGANAYLTKGNFDQNLLIETLRRLI